MATDQDGFAGWAGSFARSGRGLCHLIRPLCLLGVGSVWRAGEGAGGEFDEVRVGRGQGEFTAGCRVVHAAVAGGQEREVMSWRGGGCGAGGLGGGGGQPEDQLLGCVVPQEPAGVVLGGDDGGAGGDVELGLAGAGRRPGAAGSSW